MTDLHAIIAIPNSFSSRSFFFVCVLFMTLRVITRRSEPARWLVTFFTLCPTFTFQEFCEGNCVIQVWHAYGEDVRGALRLGNTIRQSMPGSRVGVKSSKCTS